MVWIEFFREIDNWFGYYVGVYLVYVRKVELCYYYYDNNVDLNIVDLDCIYVWYMCFYLLILWYLLWFELMVFF